MNRSVQNSMMEECRQENDEMTAALANAEDPDDATPLPSPAKKAHGSKKATGQESSTEQEKIVQAIPAEADQDVLEPNPKRNSSRIAIQVQNDAIEIAVNKQREAKEKAKALGAELSKFTGRITVKIRSKRKVNALHSDCIVSADTLHGMQPKPVVFDAKELQGKPALNNTLAKSPKAIRQIQKILVPHAISYLGYGWYSSSAGGHN